MTAGLLGKQMALLWTAVLILLANPKTGQAEEPHDGCLGCARLTSVELHDAVSSLGDVNELRAELFYFRFENAPLALPLRAPEEGARCVTTDKSDISQLVTLISEMKIVPSSMQQLEPVVEVRLYRSSRLMLEAFFTDNPMGRLDGKGETAIAVVNGNVARVYIQPVGDIVKLVEDRLTGPKAGRTCETFKPLSG